MRHQDVCESHVPSWVSLSQRLDPPAVDMNRYLQDQNVHKSTSLLTLEFRAISAQGALARLALGLDGRDDESSRVVRQYSLRPIQDRCFHYSEPVQEGFFLVSE